MTKITYLGFFCHFFPIMYCSVRLTGTSSCATSTVSQGLLPTGYLWIPAKRGQKGALVAVCTSTLKSASKKHQNCAPPCLSTAYGTPKVVKRTVYCVYILVLENNLSLVPCA